MPQPCSSATISAGAMVRGQQRLGALVLLLHQRLDGFVAGADVGVDVVVHLHGDIGAGQPRAKAMVADVARRLGRHLLEVLLGPGGAGHFAKHQLFCHAACQAYAHHVQRVLARSGAWWP